MEEIIKRFLSVSDGTGYGSGDGSGYGSGDGTGYGSGDGSGDGTGYGSGDGSGDGSGYGYGSGDGSGYGLSTYNGQKIYMVDDVASLIDSVHGQYAKGNIVNSDFTLTPCYIARNGNYFAHGSTLEDARRDAEAKALQNESIEQRIERFMTTYPNVDAAIPIKELYVWHNVLTGSCEFGRKSFAKDHDIDIENGSMTVRDFIELTKNAFGGDVIKQLKEAYDL